MGDENAFQRFEQEISFILLVSNELNRSRDWARVPPFRESSSQGRRISRSQSCRVHVWLQGRNKTTKLEMRQKVRVTVVDTKKRGERPRSRLVNLQLVK